jgi:hypothetical protein
MSNTGGVLDTYLIAQALGWDWNLWTMITIDAILLGIGIVIIVLVGLFCMWVESW